MRKMNNMDLIEKLDKLQNDYQELNKRISDPEVINDTNQYQKLLKKHAKLKKVVDKYKHYKEILAGIKEARDILEGEEEADVCELAELELAELEPEQEKLEEELPVMLLPEDPNDEKNVIVEIRAGAGGDEAGLFAADLYRMYSRYAEKQGWKVEAMGSNSSGIGGFKEVIFTVEGTDVFHRLKYESGVHRVQRVPATESSGRIHTSTATVAVLPEAEEVELEIDPNELKIDVYRSSGPGGQSVNTTDSAVRITHEPTGLVVSCQDEKSQHKNKAKAMRVLRARLKEKYEQEQQAEIDEARKSQVGTGERSEKIRTYNFPQGRVSDHRINLTVHKLEQILGGDLDIVIEELIKEDTMKRLQKV
ncbi:peptide chain release factor 1 [Halocella sp. SP3-1]|uniref:peptide chain release factor 1 n=1 Tax=Halocella sp. SP3-1 TaxID=2382161 RepID=UPI000F76012E|nr:peptide chain release factor 1 [Halocella sp. SP3-1]